MVKALSKNNKKKKSGRNSQHQQQQPPKKMVRESWVDRLSFVPATTTSQANNDNNNSNRFSVVSWNVLAESYCSPRSHQRLPRPFRNVVFDAPKRRRCIKRQLQHFCDLQVDILCLQEVDLDDEISKFLVEQGYDARETLRSPNGGSTGGKVDSCGIYARRDTFEVMEHKLIRLDDLATYSSSDKNGSNAQTKNGNPRNSRTEQQDGQHARSTDQGEDNGNENGDNTDGDNDTENNPMSSSLLNSNWQGLQHSFLRRNAAVMVRLRHRPTNQTIVVVNCHLFWNPGYEYVKLCQMHYLLTIAQREFMKDNNKNETLLLCGDLNSRPHGCTHSYLTHGHINAKLVAPWYAYHHYKKDDDNVVDFKTQFGGPIKEEDVDNVNNNEDDKLDDKQVQLAANRLSSISLNDESKRLPLQPVRYLLDFTLNKLCRWFRILGIDCAIEQDDEEQLRTKEGKMILFDRCRDEQRTLLTTSTRLMARRECPAGTYCINPSFLPDLEVACVHVLLTHGYQLDPRQFLTRCVVCNGRIVPELNVDAKCRILKSYEAPTDRVHDMDVFECNVCHQGYWWDDRPNSSASRVKATAHHLFVQCLRAGVPLVQHNGKDADGIGNGNNDMNVDLAMFEGQINVQEERARGWDFDDPNRRATSQLLLQQLDVVDWLKDENLKCPFDLTSAYASDSNGDDGERIPFSNVTFHFVSVLDYIYYQSSGLQLKSRLYVPTSFAELNDLKVERGHLLPSNVWPSDHLAIGATFSFRREHKNQDESKEKATTQVDNNETTNHAVEKNALAETTATPALFAVPVGTGAPPPPQLHGPRCACGCVPAIPSMFEMAELRKKHRQEQEAGD